jgi:hypothetical protein
MIGLGICCVIIVVGVYHIIKYVMRKVGYID